MYNVHDNDANEKNDEVTIDLMKLAQHLFTVRNISVMLITGFVFGILAFIFSKYVLQEKYTATLSMYVNSEDKAHRADPDDVTNLTVSRNLVESYVVVLSNDVVMEEVGQVLLSTYDKETLSEYFKIDEKNGVGYIKAKYIKPCFSISPVDETEILQVSATTGSAQLSADMCNAMSKLAPDFLTRVVGAGSVEAIGAATPPDSKSSPNNKKNAAMGFAMGVILVGGVLVLKILLDNKIRDAESFKANFHYPVMGEIPLLVSKETENRKRKDDNSGVDVDSFTAVEAFNALANNLMVSMTMNDEKVVVVSSPEMGDGKTTVTINIAKTMARMNNKVLLIGLDLRRPSIYKKMHIKNNVGFISLMRRKEMLDTVINKDEESGLEILLSGGISPNPAEMLSSKRFKDVLEQCKEKYDFIVIDSPPINMVPDACIISKMCAGILTVVRANVTRFDDFRKIIDNINLVQSEIVGVVINGVEETHKKYGKKYGYKYGYYESLNVENNNEEKNVAEDNIKVAS